MQLDGCGSVFAADTAFSLMSWQREAHMLGMTDPTSISGRKAN
jgi:hypothetical protein